VFVKINKLFSSGKTIEAAEVYKNLLPLLTFQLTSLDTFIEIQKIILNKLQILSSPYCREPHIPVSSDRKIYLNRLLQEAKFEELSGLNI
jgi:dihydrodipicolinate synthase/N-acetylneuraminate lyase